MGHGWILQIPEGLGVVDPIFLHELALELNMSVRQLGESMSAHELTVEWPSYFAYRQREQEREEQKQQRG